MIIPAEKNLYQKYDISLRPEHEHTGIPSKLRYDRIAGAPGDLGRIRVVSDNKGCPELLTQAKVKRPLIGSVDGGSHSPAQ